MNPCISIIVPVYKVEEFLPRCLASLEAQTAQEQIEVILVDDGSPDRCGQMCDDYAAGHFNARVVHKQNGGLSDARNAGIDIARGEYLLFLDSDDFLRADACALLIEAAHKSGADVVVYQFWEVYSDQEPDLPPAGAPEAIVGNEELFLALADRARGITESACDKMFRRALFEGVRFAVGVKCEDAFAMPTLFSRARSALVLKERLYFYRQRPGSIMHTRGDRSVDDRVAAHEEIVRVARERYPRALTSAKARTYHIRIVCLNAILDCPRFRTHPCWKRHIAALRACLPDLLSTKSRRWLPLRRKAYAVALCLCPEVALVYERIRFRQRRKHLVYTTEGKDS